LNQLTTRELMLLEDNLKMEANMARFAQSCVNSISDPQLKSLCQQIAQDHIHDIQTLSRYFNTQTM
jgi:hypothetical protein